jgi:2-oxoisovalerate dehydrogenase E1 component
VSEQLVTLFVEELSPLPSIRVHAAEDSFIPLGATATVTLPSRDSIVEAGLSLVKKSRGTARKPAARSRK